jgi:beta-glucosidase
VTENGVPVPKESEKPLQEALRDVFRLDYYHGYIEGVCKAVAEDGVNLTGYYAWSLMDNFEWWVWSWSGVSEPAMMESYC